MLIGIVTPASASLSGYVAQDATTQVVYEYQQQALDTSWLAYSRNRAGKELAVDMITNKNLIALLDSTKGYIDMAEINNEYLTRYNDWRRAGKVGTIQFDLNQFLNTQATQVITLDKVLLTELVSSNIVRVDKGIATRVPTLATQFASISRSGSTFTGTVTAGKENEKLQGATTFAIVLAIGIPDSVTVGSTTVDISSENDLYTKFTQIKAALAQYVGVASYSDITMGSLKGKSVQLTDDNITYTFTVAP